MRRELLRHVAFVNEVVERGVIEVLPPGRIADRLLERIYGESPFNREVTTALLGGEGRLLDGGDLTISEHTEIDFRLDSVDDRSYQLVMEQRYSFRNRIPTSTFVIFATSAPRLRDSIISGCRLPLFELWFVREDPDEPRFEDSVEAMRESVRVGMQFADVRGSGPRRRGAGPGAAPARGEAAGLGPVPRLLPHGRRRRRRGVLDRVDYMDSLRIFEVELPALAETGSWSRRSCGSRSGRPPCSWSATGTATGRRRTRASSSRCDSTRRSCISATVPTCTSTPSRSPFPVPGLRPRGRAGPARRTCLYAAGCSRVTVSR